MLSSPLSLFRGPPPLHHSCGSVGGPRTRTAGTCALVMLLRQGRAGTGCSPAGWRWGRGMALRTREGCRIGPSCYQRPLGQPAVPALLQALPHCWKRRLPALGASFQAADGDSPPGWDFPVSFLPRPGLGLVLIPRALVTKRCPMPEPAVPITEEPFVRTGLVLSQCRHKVALVDQVPCMTRLLSVPKSVPFIQGMET